MTLSVGVNLLWLVPGVVGGSEGYATGLLDRLVDRDDVSMTAFALPGFVRKYPSLAESTHAVVAPLPEGRHVVRRVLVENAWLASQLGKREIGLVHHLGGIVPPRCKVPAVVTLHDLQYLAFPEYFSNAKRRYLHLTQGPSLQRARAVLAISEFTREHAIDAFALDADNVHVIPPVIRPLPAVTADRRATILRDLGIRGDFILYPAAFYPHKNHAVLLRAFADVVKSHDVTLVLTGAVGAGAWGSAHSTQRDIAEDAVRLGIERRLRMPGYVTNDQLAALYGGASMLAFPSRFEGFGLPVVEAMSAGCAVIAADATALPAVVGDAGLLIDPDDDVGWGQAMAGLLADPKTRRKLADAGLDRAHELAAVDPTDRLVEIYASAAG